jgi:hypothetical protein
MTTKPDFGFVYEGLKDFQRLSVDYIFNRLYHDPDQVNRFLIADEVGLGKTLVARGIIAKSLDYLWDKIERLDIIYICSNADIARQNVNRLNLSANGFTLASRITMLPAKLKELNQNKLNFISFTPGTSFNLHSSTGIINERALIYTVLKEAWGFGDDLGPINMMQCMASEKNWRSHIESYQKEQASYLDEELKQGFIEALREKPELKRTFFKLSHRYRIDNVHNTPWRERNRLVGDLRYTLATSCIHAMKPDIIILDEFQRFKNLLDDQDPMSQLAQHLFNYQDTQKAVDTKILLLSATPYKMYTMNHEADDEEHHTDFIRTMRFLYDSEEKTEEVKQLLQEYRRKIYSLSGWQNNELDSVKKELEIRLRQVMVRTERLAVSDDRNGMVKDHSFSCRFTVEDLISFNQLDSICRELKVGDHLEYWKAAPYLLNLMDEYALKRKLKASLNEPGYIEKLYKLIRGSNNLLRWSRINLYKSTSSENPKLREIIKKNVDVGWQLLWMPPALPYYQPASVFADEAVKGFTKMLVFSSWKVVPKAIAAICSYEAERQAILAHNKEVTYINSRRKIAPLLQFAYSEERLTGMPVLAMLYPCLTLAKEIDPFELAKRSETMLTREDIFGKVKDKIEKLLDAIIDKEAYPRTGPADEKWYWAALALLDSRNHFNALSQWFSAGSDLSFYKLIEGKDESETRFAEHVQEFVDFFNNPKELGRIPDDLSDVLAKLALGSPAIAVLRSLGRKDLNMGNIRALASAAKVAVGFRSLFNLPVSISIIRQLQVGKPYWEAVLDYAIDGNLQAVLDEYCHVLYESLGLMSTEEDHEKVESISEAIYEAISLRTARAEFDDLRLDGKERIVISEARNIRCHYALRMQDSKTEDGELSRESQVRAAFNSPFRPFILASTSIGQEGLDFHQYCHAICHWNLPSNPVDLEQREGRIHRYKGHVIRKNIAKHYGLGSMGEPASKDPWDELFLRAVKDRKPSENDLVPYWLFETTNGYKIERHIPLIPLSRDIGRIDNLKRGLVLYRMVFGQPRQEDLINYLQNTLGEDQLHRAADYRINLEPRLPT